MEKLNNRSEFSLIFKYALKDLSRNYHKISSIIVTLFISLFILSAILLAVWFILMLRFIFPSSKNDMVIKIKPEFFKQSDKSKNLIFNKIENLDFVDEALIFPSESYIIIKLKRNTKFDNNKVMKILGEKNAIS